MRYEFYRKNVAAAQFYVTLSIIVHLLRYDEYNEKHAP